MSQTPVVEDVVEDAVENVVENPVDGIVVEEPLVAADLLVEDVSIDGMCGVY